MKVYVASSWRNAHQPGLVELLRAEGHEIYDFRHPAPGDDGFHWSEIDPAWQAWSAEGFRQGLDHDMAQAGFAKDMKALRECDACVCVLPCGRSAHLELGHAAGAGKLTAVLLTDFSEPELMYRMLHAVCVTPDEVAAWLRDQEQIRRGEHDRSVPSVCEVFRPWFMNTSPRE